MLLLPARLGLQVPPGPTASLAPSQLPKLEGLLVVGQVWDRQQCMATTIAPWVCTVAELAVPAAARYQ